MYLFSGVSFYWLLNIPLSQRVLALEDNFLLQFHMDVSNATCVSASLIKHVIDDHVLFFPLAAFKLISLSCFLRPAVKKRERETLRRSLTTMMW